LTVQTLAKDRQKEGVVDVVLLKSAAGQTLRPKCEAGSQTGINCYFILYFLLFG
jgi:hypothetical protein